MSTITTPEFIKRVCDILPKIWSPSKVFFIALTEEECLHQTFSSNLKTCQQFTNHEYMKGIHDFSQQISNQTKHYWRLPMNEKLLG